MGLSRSSRGPAKRIAIVVSRYNASITDALLEGALSAWSSRTILRSARHIVLEAAGSFELVALARAAADQPDVLGIVTLGCIIKGETEHDVHLAGAVAQGLTAVTVQTGVPIAFGVLTVRNAAQARARAGTSAGADNKGREAMEALLATLGELERFSGTQGAGVRNPLARPDKARSERKRT